MEKQIQKAQWICAEEFLVNPIWIYGRENGIREQIEQIHPNELKNYHMLVRKKFHFDKKSENVWLDITADDYYKLYVNGHFVGQGPSPSYETRYYYNHYEITDYLRNGENVIAVHTYYQGNINRVWNSGDLRQGLKAVCYDKNGIILQTDGTWKYKRARQYVNNRETGYHTQYLEDIDMTKYDVGWKDINFEEKEWKSAMVKSEDDHCLVLQETKSLELYEVFPQSIKELEKGIYILDFGKEVVGYVRLQTEGIKGETVEVFAGEELLEDGHVRFQMRCNCTYHETWILSGRKEIIENYDYKTFRYLEIHGEKRMAEQFSVIVRHYPFSNPIRLEKCNDTRLLQIWDICSRSIQLGTQEVFVDCPSREKGQYLGDMTITAKCQMILTGDPSMYKKALFSFADSASVDDGLLAVAPGSFMQEIADYSLIYPMQVYEYFQYTNDEDTIKKLYPIVKGIQKHFERFQRKDGLLENVTDKWNMVDWPENLRDSYDFPLTIPIGTGCHAVINAYFYGALLYIEKLENILHLESDTKQKRRKIKEAFQKAFYQKDERLFVDAEGSKHSSLHTNSLALFFSLNTRESEQTIADLIRKKGLCCGVYMAYFVLKGLARIGEYQLMYDLMTGEGEHSWMNMVHEGATTCFEAWGKEQKWNTSLCHPWGSAPLLLTLEDIAGLQFRNRKVIRTKCHLPKQIQSICLMHGENEVLFQMDYHKS